MQNSERKDFSEKLDSSPIRAAGAHKGPRRARPSQGSTAVSTEGCKPSRDEPISARLGRNRGRLHSEVSKLSAPKTGEAACRAVVRYCKRLKKRRIFRHRKRTFRLSICLLLPPRIPALGSGPIPPQSGGNVAKRQRGTARVRGGQSAPQRGIFKGRFPHCVGEMSRSDKGGRGG